MANKCRKFIGHHITSISCSRHEYAVSGIESLARHGIADDTAICRPAPGTKLHQVLDFGRLRHAPVVAPLLGRRVVCGEKVAVRSYCAHRLQLRERLSVCRTVRRAEAEVVHRAVACDPFGVLPLVAERVAPPEVVACFRRRVRADVGLGPQRTVLPQLHALVRRAEHDTHPGQHRAKRHNLSFHRFFLSKSFCLNHRPTRTCLAYARQKPNLGERRCARREAVGLPEGEARAPKGPQGAARSPSVKVRGSFHP